MKIGWIDIAYYATHNTETLVLLLFLWIFFILAGAWINEDSIIKTIVKATGVYCLMLSFLSIAILCITNKKLEELKQAQNSSKLLLCDDYVLPDGEWGVVFINRMPYILWKSKSKVFRSSIPHSSSLSFYRIH
jgi:hypothetical protein